MKLAVLADIHGNIEALREVLADINRQKPDQVISLGDNIGYGPNSEDVIRTLRQRRIPSVVGNHEIVLQIPRYIKWFNPGVRQTVQKTLDSLSEESVAWIKNMPLFLARFGCRFVHGFPPKSPLLYLFQISDRKMIRVFENIGEKICFIGHTHELNLVEISGSTVRYLPLEPGIRHLDSGNCHIVNVGSVGQPRDGDNRAKYVIWDTVRNTLELRCVSYDIEAVVRKILDSGYPDYYAHRLR